jgi:hypothetical protein
MDPKDLNKCIKRETVQIPKREGILCEMAGAYYFSSLDASNGFWQMRLDAAPSLVQSITPLEDIPLRCHLLA